MKYIKGSTVSACLFILSVFVAFPTNDHRILAQSALHPVWIYSIITTDDARDIVKSDAYGNMPPSIIYVVPNKPKSTFGELVPQEELNFANQYYKQQGVGTADYLSALYPDVYSVSIKPSPSRQSVAINIIYRLCVNPDNFVCFGSSQLVTVFADTHQVTTLWNVGLHNENYVVCFAGLSNVDLYKMIDKIEWMSNEKAIVVSFTGPPHCFVPGADRPIFVVTIDNKQVIYAGKAIVWDVSKADNDIMELSELSNASGVSLNLIHTDLQMKTVSTKMFLFNSLFLPLINSSIIKLGDQILLNAPERKSTAGLILTSFGTRLYPHMSRMTVPQEIQSASTGEESPDGTQAVVKTSDGSLWLVQKLGDAINAFPLIMDHTSTWVWLDNKTIMYRPDSSQTYTIVDQQGHTLKQMDPNQQVKQMYVHTSGLTAIVSATDFQ